MRVKLAAKMMIIAWTLMKKKEKFNPDYIRIEEESTTRVRNITLRQKTSGGTIQGLKIDSDSIISSVKVARSSRSH